MKNILIKGTIASGKTYHAKQEALNATGLDDFARAVENGRIVYVPLYEGYGYSDFIKGTELCTKDNKLLIKPVDKQFAKLCSRASDDKSNEYAIIIDDIDRTDIATVLGEIVYAIENRGTAVNTQSSEKLTVPENLTIIAVSAVPSMNKLDYAFLRRFEHKEYFSDRGVLEKLVAERKCDAKALDEYDFYNSVIDQYIAYDLREQEKYYLLGHGWFIGKTEALVYQSMRYKVIPLIEEYVRNGVLDITYNTLCAYRNAAEKNVSDNKTKSVIKKYTRDNKSNSDTLVYDDLNTTINNYNMKAKLTQPETLRAVFEISYANELIEHDLLFTRLYTNTAILKVQSEDPNNVGSFLCEYSLSQTGGFKYNNNTSHENKPSWTYIKTESKTKYEYYSFLNTKYMLIQGVRDNAGKDIKKANYYKYNSKAAAYSQPIIYLIMYNFYLIYKKGIELQKKNDSDNNLKLLEIINDDIRELETYKQKDIDIGTILDRKTFPVFTHKLGDSITKIINGEPVTATLEGVYKMADKDYKAIMDSMNIKQMILQGPPGTSKTYGARQFLKEQLEVQEGRDETVIENDLKECQINDELYSKLKDGTIIFDKDFYWDIVQFHPSYGYEDFVRGITVQPIETSNNKLKGEIKPITGAQSIEIEAPSMGIKYETVDKILGKTAKFALKAKEFNKPVYLIIDEINRANVSSVFGELIYALEYRNEKIATPYSVDGINEIEIPDNLYLIGTMNTADKSIGNIDYAVRRRFIFFPMLPDVNVIENSDNSAKKLAVFLFKKTEELFDDYLNEDYNKDDVQVGHTMFLAKDEEETKLKFVYQVLPILREYYKDGVLISSDGNKIINYLSKFGRNDHISEEELWEELLSEYNLSADEQTADVHS